MIRPTAVWRPGVVVTVATAALAACAPGVNPAANGPAQGAARETASTSLQRHEPVAVRGVESCAGLPQDSARPAATEDRLPALTLPCLTPGPAVDLSSLGGRPVLINLWATWCGPCREEMPILQDAHTKHGNKIAFLGVDTKDNPQRAAAFLQEVGVTYPQVVDLDGRLLSEHLRVPGLPVTVVIDAKGEVVKKHVGPFTAKSLEDLLHEVADD